MEINKIIQSDCLTELRKFPDNSIDCCITSPPYWALRTYLPNDHIDKPKELGQESTFTEYITKLCDIFDEIKRVLKPTGTCWVNIGDVYSSQGGLSKPEHLENAKVGATKSGQQRGMRYILNAQKSRFNKKEYNGKQGIHCGRGRGAEVPDKCLCQIPSRFAIAMTDRGWLLRNSVIWCIIEDTMLLVKEGNQYKYLPIKELKFSTEQDRFLPTQNQRGDLIWVKIKNVFYNGEKECLKITTKSGREVICTPEHQFVYRKSIITYSGQFRKISIKKASELKESDYLYVNEELKAPLRIDTDYNDGFIVGFYLAEGSYTKNKVGKYKENILSKAAQRRWGRQKEHNKIVGLQFSCGKSDSDKGYFNRFNFYKIKIYQYGNEFAVASRDKKLLSLIQKFVIGERCYDKHLSQEAWKQSKDFLLGVIEGFLSGDGYYDKKNDRYIIGIAPNYDLKNDLELLCRFLGWQFRFCSVLPNSGRGRMKITIRKKPIQKRVFGCIIDRIDKIEKVGNQNVYDIEIEPIYTSFCGKGKKSEKETKQKKFQKWNHLYFLGNGIWTHNSKPNSMPSSIRDRFSCSYEFVYFFVKNRKYYFDLDIIRKTPQNVSVSRYGRQSNPNKHKQPYQKNSPISNLCKEYKKKIYGEDKGNRARVLASLHISHLKQDNVPSRNANTYKGFNERYRNKYQDTNYGGDGSSFRGHSGYFDSEGNYIGNIDGSNPRDVWSLPTYPEGDIEHYAQFPATLLIQPILAGCPEFVCSKCGKPQITKSKKVGYLDGVEKGVEHPDNKPYAIKERTGFVGIRDLPPITEIKDYLNEWRKKKGLTIEEIENHLQSQAPHHFFNGESYPTKEDWLKIKALLGFDDKYDKAMTEEKFKPAEKLTGQYTKEIISCKCNAEFSGGIVLDPFIGSGTTGLVAKVLNRNYIGIDLNGEFIKMAETKINDPDKQRVVVEQMKQKFPAIYEKIYQENIVIAKNFDQILSDKNQNLLW